MIIVSKSEKVEALCWESSVIGNQVFHSFDTLHLFNKMDVCEIAHRLNIIFILDINFPVIWNLLNVYVSCSIHSLHLFQNMNGLNIKIFQNLYVSERKSKHLKIIGATDCILQINLLVWDSWTCVWTLLYYLQFSACKITNNWLILTEKSRIYTYPVCSISYSHLGNYGLYDFLQSCSNLQYSQYPETGSIAPVTNNFGNVLGNCSNIVRPSPVRLMPKGKYLFNLIFIK